MIETSAPAKIILFGEHAVVYNKPAIAVPVSSLRAVATTNTADPQTTSLKIVANDLNMVLPIEIDKLNIDNALSLTVHLVLKHLNADPPPLTITLTSTIPMASGLGSGASVATALARTLSAALGHTMSNDELNAIIYEVEKLNHGTPSGIDNTVIVYEHPVFFVRGKPLEHLSISHPFTLLIADTGHSALTHIAVSAVRDLYNADQDATQIIFDDIEAIAQHAKIALSQGDLNTLGDLMIQNHALLQKLTVSSPQLNALVDAAMHAGALGAKLSGGGRGGNMIALVTDETHEQVKNALLNAGAKHVYQTTVANTEAL